MFLEAIAASFDSISGFEKEADQTHTRFIFTADFEGLSNDLGTTWLLDFAFPDLGQLEYMRRIFNLDNMADLQEIVFYLDSDEHPSPFKIYNFFDDAPWAFRCGIGHDCVYGYNLAIISFTEL